MDQLTALVLRAQSGDMAAYEAIVERFEGMAVGYANSVLGGFHLAQDAAQEAFVGAYLELATLEDPRARFVPILVETAQAPIVTF